MLKAPAEQAEVPVVELERGPVAVQALEPVVGAQELEAAQEEAASQTRHLQHPAKVAVAVPAVRVPLIRVPR